MTEMVERVARVLFGASQASFPARTRLSWGGEYSVGGKDPFIENKRQHHRDLARAAIAAMREPTNAMTEEGAVYLIEHNPKEPISPRYFYQAMIDEALK